MILARAPHDRALKPEEFPWNKTEDTPGFTGLPTDVLYMTQIEELKTEIQDLRRQFQLLKESLVVDNSRVIEEVCAKIERELDLRSVGGEGYGLSCEIERKLDQLISRLDSSSRAPPLGSVQQQAQSSTTTQENDDDKFLIPCDVEEEIVEITFDDPTAA